MIRVLNLRSSFDLGGTETSLVDLFNEDTRCFRTHIALLKYGSLISRLEPLNANILFKTFRKRYLDPSVLASLSRIIKDHEIQIIHAHQLIELVYAVCLKVRFRKLRIVHQYHTMFDQRGIKFRLERFLSQQFASILTVSNSAKEELVHSFGFKERLIDIIYNGIDDTNLNRSGNTSDLTKLGFRFDGNRINVVMVANFVWGKDHKTVFEAYDRYIREEMPEICLYFIGRQTEISKKLVEKYLNTQDLESGRIILTGAVPNAKRLLPAFDVVLMSSFSETFNKSVVEAAMYGRPLITSDIPVFNELSESGRLFRLFKTGNPLDLFTTLKRFIDELHQFEDHAEHFKEKFGINRLVSNLCSYYKRIIRFDNNGN